VTHVDGAAHEGAPLQGLLHDLVQLLGGLLHLVELRHPPGEVLHGLGGVPALQGLVGPVEPGGGGGGGEGGDGGGGMLTRSVWQYTQSVDCTNW